MIVSALGTHNLSSWNVFSEESGDLSFRLKFKIIQDIQPSDIHIPPVRNTISYRRKNSTQVIRDRARAVKRPRVSTDVSNSIETERAEPNLEIDCSDISETSVIVHENVTSIPATNIQPLEIPTTELSVIDCEYYIE